MLYLNNIIGRFIPILPAFVTHFVTQKNNFTPFLP